MLSVAAAAKELGMTPQGVRHAIHRGKIAATRVVPTDGSPLKSVFVIEEAEMERFRTRRRKPGGSHLRATATEKAIMARSGHLTMVEAAREIGVAASHLTHLATTGKVKSVKRSILYMHRDEVARLKRERDAKIAALEG